MNSTGGKTIYIPICLYLNNNQREVFYQIIVIYIPICLYLNWATLEKNRASVSFTFQYVPI